MLLKDLPFAFRTLRKSPLFALTAIVTIALGIGASTAIFSVTNAVLLRPLPYKDPDRLIVAGGDMRTRNILDERVSYENYMDLKQGTSDVLNDMAAVATFRGVIPQQDGSPERIQNAIVTTNFMRLLGAKIVAGRDFEESDGQAPPPPDPTAPLPALGRAVRQPRSWAC